MEPPTGADPGSRTGRLILSFVLLWQRLVFRAHGSGPHFSPAHGCGRGSAYIHCVERGIGVLGARRTYGYLPRYAVPASLAGRAQVGRRDAPRRPRVGRTPTPRRSRLPRAAHGAAADAATRIQERETSVGRLGLRAMAGSEVLDRTPVTRAPERHRAFPRELRATRTHPCAGIRQIQHCPG